MIDGYTLGEGAIIISKVLQDINKQRVENVEAFERMVVNNVR